MAANKTAEKNTIATNCPAGKSLKIIGIVINIRGGPDFNSDSSPKENTAGIITTAASIDAIKLKKQIFLAQETTSSLSFK